MAGDSWRVDDVVAYDVMRESVTVLTSLILTLSGDDQSQTDRAVTEVIDLQNSVTAIDGRDRKAVAELHGMIVDRIKHLSEVPR